VITENSVRSENKEVPIIREIMATTMSSLFVAFFAVVSLFTRAVSSAMGQPVCDDGNDIGRFDSRQIEEAQRYGCAIDDWLSESGFHPLYIPADAITIEVGPAIATPPNSSHVPRTGQKAQGLYVTSLSLLQRFVPPLV
jgi:hypothetical protein